MKVVHHSFRNLLHCLVDDHIKSWDLKLSQAEFTHNLAVNHIMGFCLFLIVYVLVLCGPLDLLILPSRTRMHGQTLDFIERLQKLHVEPQAHLLESTTNYKAEANLK